MLYFSAIGYSEAQISRFRDLGKCSDKTLCRIGKRIFHYVINSDISLISKLFECSFRLAEWDHIRREGPLLLPVLIPGTEQGLRRLPQCPPEEQTGRHCLWTATGSKRWVGTNKKKTWRHDIVIFWHYCDIITTTMASQITSLTIVYSTVYSCANQGKHQSSVSLTFKRGIHMWPVNSPHKGQ